MLLDRIDLDPKEKIMASIMRTTCDKCGGPAYFTADDGVTRCENPK